MFFFTFSTNLLCYILWSFVFCFTTFLGIFLLSVKWPWRSCFFQWWFSSVCGTRELINLWNMNFSCYWYSRKLHTTIHNTSCATCIYTNINAHIWKSIKFTRIVQKIEWNFFKKCLDIFGRWTCIVFQLVCTLNRVIIGKKYK